MTYRPPAAAYGPPWLARVPAVLYFVLALGAGAAVAAAEKLGPGTWLYHYVVERDPDRLISARVLAVIVVASGIAAVLRAGMRGVRILPEGVVCREVLTLGWPRIRRFRWAQIDRIILDQPNVIALDLWDGTREFLPPVGDRAGLAATLERVAAARAIPVRGGQGLDELPDSEEGDE